MKAVSFFIGDSTIIFRCFGVTWRIRLGWTVGVVDCSRVFWLSSAFVGVCFAPPRWTFVTSARADMRCCFSVSVDDYGVLLDVYILDFYSRHIYTCLSVGCFE